MIIKYFAIMFLAFEVFFLYFAKYSKKPLCLRYKDFRGVIRMVSFGRPDSLPAYSKLTVFRFADHTLVELIVIKRPRHAHVFNDCERRRCGLVCRRSVPRSEDTIVEHNIMLIAVATVDRFYSLKIHLA